MLKRCCLVSYCFSAAACGSYEYDLGTRMGAAGAPGVVGFAGAPGVAGFEFGPPFSDPELLGTLSDPVANDDDPSLTEDLLEIYFSSQRDGGLGEGDIWRSERATATAEWDPPIAVPELNSEFNETSVAVEPDGLTLWVSSDRDGSVGGTDVWVTRRAERGAAWGPLRLVEGLSTDGDEIVRGVDRTSGSLLLAWREAEGTAFDLFVARPDSDGTFGVKSPITELNTGDNEADPFLAEGGRVLFYTASRDNDDDLMVAVRDDANTSFVLLRPLDELNSGAADNDAWVSADQKMIFFASRRQNDQLDLYVASR